MKRTLRVFSLPGDGWDRERLKTRIGFVLQAAFWVLLVYFCVAFLLPKWESLRLSQRLGELRTGWLLAAAGLLVGQYLYLFAVWFLLLRQLGARPAPGLAFRAYALALLPRYVPGKVVSQGVRAGLTIQAGVPGPAVSSSLIWEAVLALGSAALIGVFGLFHGFSGALFQAARWLIAAFVVGSILFATAAGTRLLGTRWKKWVGVRHIAARPLIIAGFLGLYFGSWAIFGVSHWLLANALAPQPWALIFPLTSALAVSWGLGFISVIAPAGLGVREGVLYVFIVSVMSEANSLLFVTLSRVLAFMVELLVTGIWALLAIAVTGGRTRGRSR